jgi:hypothetical protein
VGPPGLEPGATSASSVADRRANAAKDATKDDAKRPEVSASGDDVEAALAKALEQAAAAGRFDVVSQLARELEARRLALAGNVIPLEAKARRGTR